MFIWSSFLSKSKEDKYLKKYIASSLTLSEKKRPTNLKSKATAKNLFSSAYVNGTACFNR